MSTDIFVDFVESSSSLMSSYQALPLASPHPPKRQLISATAFVPESNVNSTFVQSLVPFTASVCEG